MLLYDLTSTYFEGQAAEIPAARRGYSRDSRPDALQLILAMVVTEEGLPLSYEVFEGNRADVTTLEEILDSVERKHGKLGRVWVFDRGIVSEENLNLLRSRGASYLVATPKRLLTQFQEGSDCRGAQQGKSNHDRPPLKASTFRSEHSGFHRFVAELPASFVTAAGDAPYSNWYTISVRYESFEPWERSSSGR